MGLTIGVIALVVVCMLAGHAGAENVSTGALTNRNPQDASSVSASCQAGPDDQRMSCKFVQIRVDLVRSPEAAAAALDRQMRQATPEEMAKSLCDGNERKSRDESLAQLRADPEVTAKAKEFVTEQFRRIDAMCAKPSSDSMREMVEHMINKDTKTCRIWTHYWEQTFARQDADKWVSNVGPDGICGVVEVSVLERIRDTAAIVPFWTYRTRKVVTKRATGPFCALDETTTQYSQFAKAPDRVCDFIQFGP